MIGVDLNVLIQQRAYEIWQMEGCPGGRERIHWLRAEAEFRERLYETKPKMSGIRLQVERIGDGPRLTQSEARIPRRVFKTTDGAPKRPSFLALARNWDAREKEA